MSEIVTIEDDCLVIRIHRETLATAARLCPKLETYSEDMGRFRKVTTTDAEKWLKSVADALTREQGEDGTTLVHMMLDSAFAFAVDQGYEGIEIEGLS